MRCSTKSYGAGAHTDPALAAARLPPVGFHRRALQIAAAGHRDGHILHRHQIFEVDLASVLDNLGATLIAELFLDFPKLLDRSRLAERCPIPESPGTGRCAAGCPASSSRIFCCLHPGQPLQLQLDDRLGLLSR